MNANDPEVVPPSIGLVGGKYQLVSRIGRGGMGSVWSAKHATLGTSFAIKFIEAEYAGSQEARSRFDKEAKAAATIQSKHAIQIYDHGVTDDGKPYIVMELLNGEPLDKRIERLGTLTLADTARILQQVCRALARAHDQGIVHRDLKPENIFIVRNADEDEEFAKVLDFGIAKIQSSATNPSVTSSTKTGAVLGTPFYMSPEQARGLRNVDHRTDIWSLGIIAYKCVTGLLPFDGESVGDLLVKICTAPVPVPSQRVPGLPQSFDHWFARALEREPERRFSSVGELAEHLAFAAGQSFRAVVPSFGPGGAATVATGNSGAASPFTQPLVADAGGSLTPPPAGMTAAPFTSSSQISTGPSKVRWAVVSAAIGLTIAAVTTGAVLALKRNGASAAPRGLAATTAPSATSPTDPPDPTPLTDPRPLVAPVPSLGVAAPPLGSVASESSSAKSAPASAKPSDRHLTTKPTAAVVAAPPPLPPPGGLQTAAPSVVGVVAAPPPPAATSKKPPKNDPGY